MKKFKNLYKSLQTNNITVYSLIAFVLINNILSFIFMFKINNESKRNIYGITERGLLVPFEKLELKEDIITQVKANMNLFVYYYYDLDGYTMKSKKEKLLWLVDKQPTEIIKDRENKGYFNSFLSINGLVQHAKVIDKSWKISSLDEPYRLSFEVIIVRINGDNKNYYKSKISVELKEVNKNYPYNPYGLLITKLSENYTKIDSSEL